MKEGGGMGRRRFLQGMAAVAGFSSTQARAENSPVPQDGQLQAAEQSPANIRDATDAFAEYFLSKFREMPTDQPLGEFTPEQIEVLETAIHDYLNAFARMRGLRPADQTVELDAIAVEFALRSLTARSDMDSRALEMLSHWHDELRTQAAQDPRSKRPPLKKPDGGLDT